MRNYYVSKEIIDSLIEEDSVDCYIKTKNNCNVITLSSDIQQTDFKVGRHDLAILYKTMYLKSHTFQLSFDFVDCGDNGYNYSEGEILTQKKRNDFLKKDSVLIYSITEEKDNNTVFYNVEVLDDDTEEQSEIDMNSTIINIDSIMEGLNNGSFVILPINKENSIYNYVKWSKNSNTIFKFHKNYTPKLYDNITSILNDKVTVPKDFVIYDFFVMNKSVETDDLGNEWISLSYYDSLNTLNLIEMDKTGKTHMYILDNFKDIDKNYIYDSFMKLDKDNISFETILRVIEKVQPISTTWFEDYVIEIIKKDYLSSDKINILVKYVRVSNKSKDRDIERLLDLMLYYKNRYHINGYVRILKALKLKEDKLKKYIDIIISEDKKSKSMGYLVSHFIDNWKSKSFKELEDYLYEGIKTQPICMPYSSFFSHMQTEEERQRRGLNTNYDFVKNYLSLIDVKCVDKENLIKRYIEGIKNDSEHFPSSKLLDKLSNCIHYNEKEDLSKIIPLFIDCIVCYDEECKYAKEYLPEKKLREIFGYSWNVYSRYTDAFEPYIECLYEMVIKNEKMKKINY